MFHLNGYENIIKSIYKISKTKDFKRKIDNFDQLKKAYLDFLQSYRPNLAINYSKDLIITDKKIEDNLSQAFAKSELDDLNQSNVIGDQHSDSEKEEKILLVREALNDLLSLDANFTKIFNLAIHSIFVRKDSRENSERMTHGGSSSGAIGVIWVSCEDKIRKEDLVEIFIHEITHTLVFIDELNTKQFYYSEMIKEENYARSAILLYNRPMDKVVHSIIVGTEILMSRESFLQYSNKVQVHPNSKILAKNIILACESIFALKNYEKVVTQRTIDLVCECKDYCDKLINYNQEKLVSLYA